MVLTPVTADGLGILSPDWSANPPNGRTGAPGDGLCSDCHTQLSPPQDGTVSISGMPATITPNMVYTLTVTVDNPNGLASLGGFQMVVLNSGNTNAGSMDNPSTSSTVTPAGGRVYHEHNPVLSFGAGTQVMYSVDWTAPPGPDMEVITAYAAGNVANGNGSNSGDLIVTTNTSGTISGSALEVEVETADALCFNSDDGIAEAVVTGGVPGFTYAWSNGATTQTIGDLTAGTYCVTVTDNDGNTAEACSDVLEPTAVAAALVSSSGPSCMGSNDGTIVVSASGGVGGYTYAWSNGAVGASISGLAQGMYTVTVADANGCTDVLAVTLTDPAELVILLVDLADPTCFGESTGAIVVSASGGTGSIEFEWSTGATGPTLSDIPAGTYSVTAEDANGCISEEIYVLVDPEPLDLQLELLNDVSCNGDTTGTLIVTVSGGQTPYSFAWSNGGTTAEISTLPAGAYTVTVTDQNGCAATATIEITEPGELMANVTSTDETSAGAEDGTVMSNPTGGTPPFTYIWSNAATTSMIAGLSPSTYDVTVTDSNGCTDVQSGTVNAFGCNLLVDLTIGDVSCNGITDGFVEVMYSGAVGPVSFLWSNGATTQSISNLGPGTYSVTVTDSAGCAAMATAFINEPPALSTECTVLHEGGPGANDGFIGCIVSGGKPPYVMPGEMITDNIFQLSGLAPGQYEISITDANGCLFTELITINMFGCPGIDSVDVLDVLCHGENSGSASVEFSGGQSMITVSWSNGFIGNPVTMLEAGSYSVTISDTSGCTSTTNFVVAEPDAISLTVDKIIDVTEENYGAIEISVSGGTPPYAYDWMLDGNTISTDQDPDSLSLGSYIVVVTDANGCSFESDTIHVGALTSVKNVEFKIHLSIFPNPVTDVATLQWDPNITLERVELWSVQGALMKEVQLDAFSSGQLTLDLRNFAQGIYYVIAIGPDGKGVFKLIKF